MFGFGIGELLIILVIFIVIFGAGKIGDVGGDLGKAIRNFRKAMNEPEAIDVTPESEEDDDAGKKDDEKKEP